mmetsp:Transcript_25773/g.34197  ORF Transcript_25773/g.34197 Transcript_25773/m.34197 type:complete len:84 (+) Transcript_25773:640-891(+)
MGDLDVKEKENEWYNQCVRYRYGRKYRQMHTGTHSHIYTYPLQFKGEFLYRTKSKGETKSMVVTMEEESLNLEVSSILFPFCE